MSNESAILTAYSIILRLRLSSKHRERKAQSKP